MIILACGREMTHAWSVVVHLWLRSGSTLVQVGRDGRLFFRGDDMVRQSAGLLVRELRIIETADTINAVRAARRPLGIRLIFAPPPNSATIYPDLLPPWARNLGRLTEYDGLLAALAARGVQTVDLRPPLRAARAKGAVFFEHDTHWSPRGALAGFNAIVAAVRLNFWQFDPAVALASPTQRIGGDLARMLGVADATMEQTEELTLPSGQSESFRGVTMETFLSTPKRPGGLTVLVLGDSFTPEFSLMVNANTARFAWTHHEWCGFDWKWVERFHPDQVWWMPTERYALCVPGSRPKGMPAT